MFSVLIVDDEPLVQIGLQSMIDWASLDIRLLPCASNGQAAWESILKDRPNLVITDIKMPLMDGLQLIRRCRQEFEPCPAFVVLTSHEDFAFAREAVKHQVVDYLVKLELTPEVLLQTVLRVRQGTQTKGGVDRDRPDPSRLWGLLERTWATEDEALKYWGRPAPAWTNWLAVASCRIGEEGEAPSYAARMLQEILGREYTVESAFRGDLLALVLAAPPGLDRTTLETRMAASLESALEMVQRYFNRSVPAGLGSVGKGVRSLSEAWWESLRALEAGSSGVTVYSHLAQPPSLVSGEAFRQGLEQALAALDGQATSRWFAEARAAIEAHGRLTDALDLGTSAQYAVLAAVADGEALLATIFSDHAEGYKHLFAVPSPGHVLAWLATLERGLLDHLDRLGSRHQEKLVESMRRHVEAHYRERLPLKTVADQFRLSPNYAGTLFRRFVGQSFSEFVSHVKVAKAQEMLTSRKYRIYEISEFLGFENTYYFSKVFRRVAGCSPREYVASLTSDEDSGSDDREKC